VSAGNQCLSAAGLQLFTREGFPPVLRPACHSRASWSKGNVPLFRIGDEDNSEALLFTTETL